MQQSAKTRCISSGVLILDDTILEKTGNQMAGVRKLFDHAKKTFVNGLSLVQLFYVDSQKRYPLWYALHSNRGRKPKPTKDRTVPIGKYKIALRLIRQAIECGIRPKAVLFDAWYASVRFLKSLHKMGLSFVSRLASSRYLLVNGIRIKAADLLKQKHRYRYYKSLKAKAFAVSAILPHFGEVTVVCVKYRNKSAVIITNLNTYDLVYIVSLYRQRWAIEVYFREAKQVFGLDKFQNRSASSIQAHLALTALA
ncbi:transposase [candidate division TA06 bacterium]|uniref:Transposase n=1 Tax=candidate division TA06 bacterium TaxID=2250710 RepID=A0A933I790_UNCT6|nr:transposase [candidate division TA06 bacterium]